MHSDLKALFSAATQPQPVRVAAELALYFKERPAESFSRDLDMARLLEQEGYFGHGDLSNNTHSRKKTPDSEQATAVSSISHAVDVLKGNKTNHTFILKSLSLFEHYRK